MSGPVGSAGASLPVLTAVTGRWEARLVRGLEVERGVVEVVRRCADLADLLATAASGAARAVVVSADLRWLDAEALARLAASGCAVVALVEPGDDPAERRLRQLGVGQVLPADADPALVSVALRLAVEDQLARPGESAMAFGDPRAALPGAAPSGGDELSEPNEAPGGDHHAHDGAELGGRPPGRVVVVWGPAGAPGRTTTAVTLAAELAAAGHGTLLVDADTYAASIAQVLGLLDEAPGLASAARAADHGTLDLAQLSRLSPQVVPGLRVLTGLARAHRWPELRPSSLTTVLSLARRLVPYTVVDTGFCLEQDEELSYDTAAPRRNGATLAAIAAADTLVAVGTADPVGLQRLVRGLHDLAEVSDLQPVVVVTRVRSTSVGQGPGRRVREALQRYAGVDDPVLVPDDAPALDAALLGGRTITESAPGSPARVAHLELAARVGALDRASVRAAERATAPAHRGGLVRRS